MDIVWINLDSKPLVTGDGEIVTTDTTGIKLPQEPRNLEVDSDPWQSGQTIDYTAYSTELVDPLLDSAILFSLWAARVTVPSYDADVYRTKVEATIAGETIHANTWILHRFSLTGGAFWWGSKAGLPNGPTGVYTRFAASDDPAPDPNPATLTVAYA